MATAWKICWFPFCIFAFFFCRLFLLGVFIFVVYKIGFTHLLHLFVVLTGTEEEVMKLDKSQGGKYDFIGTRASYRKADKCAKEFIETERGKSK